MRHLVVLALTLSPASAAVVVTGHSVVTVDDSRSPGAFVAVDADRELIQNGDFETGQMSPWTTSTWIVDTKNPHGGTYCADVVGNQWIRQFIDTVPASEIQSITFWSRQPDQPAAQAYDFFYSDGSFEEFVHFPQPNWRQFDVTGYLNRSKSLVGLGIWGYSGGGPGPDSTYLDDVSIQTLGRGHDVTVSQVVWPRDTVEYDTFHFPRASVANVGAWPESCSVVMMIEDICWDPYYFDTVRVSLLAGAVETVSFDTWRPRYPALHRVSCWTTLAGDTNRTNDTVRQFFWVRPGVGVSEAPASGEPRTAVATVVRGVLWLPPSPFPLPEGEGPGVRGGSALLDATGREVMTLQPGPNDVRHLAPGAYYARRGRTTARLLLLR